MLHRILYVQHNLHSFKRVTTTTYCLKADIFPVCWKTKVLFVQLTNVDGMVYVCLWDFISLRTYLLSEVALLKV